jgi:hypothetical protein
VNRFCTCCNSVSFLRVLLLPLLVHRLLQSTCALVRLLHLLATPVATCAGERAPAKRPARVSFSYSARRSSSTA